MTDALGFARFVGAGWVHADTCACPRCIAASDMVPSVPLRDPMFPPTRSRPCETCGLRQAWWNGRCGPCANWTAEDPPDERQRLDGVTAAGDPDYLEALEDLRALHVEKSETYGVEGERLSNYLAVSAVTDEPPELYAVERIVEKCQRAVNMLRAGAGDAVAEYLDIAGLALCAEALRRRG